jgi:uncharacterized phiE125 gp8 family phage protein
MITDDRNQFAPAAGLNAPRLVLVTAPAAEPVTLVEAKLWLKVDDSADDALLTELIKSARRVFEEITGRSLIDTVWRAEWDHLPRDGSYAGAPLSRILELPRAPLKATSPVAWVKYSADDSSGTETTFSSGSYTVDAGRDPNRYPRLWLNDSADWPTLGSFPGALRCQFTAGYGAAASDVPEEIKVCLKLLVSHLYQNRTPVNIGNIVNEISYSLRFLIELHQIRPIA